MCPHCNQPIASTMRLAHLMTDRMTCLAGHTWDVTDQERAAMFDVPDGFCRTCPGCNGTREISRSVFGHPTTWIPCPSCGGRGYVMNERMRIPMTSIPSDEIGGAMRNQDLANREPIDRRLHNPTRDEIAMWALLDALDRGIVDIQRADLGNVRTQYDDPHALTAKFKIAAGAGLETGRQAYVNDSGRLIGHAQAGSTPIGMVLAMNYDSEASDPNMRHSALVRLNITDGTLGHTLYLVANPYAGSRELIDECIESTQARYELAERMALRWTERARVLHDIAHEKVVAMGLKKDDEHGYGYDIDAKDRGSRVQISGGWGRRTLSLFAGKRDTIDVGHGNIEEIYSEAELTEDEAKQVRDQIDAWLARRNRERAVGDR